MITEGENNNLLDDFSWDNVDAVPGLKGVEEINPPKDDKAVEEFFKSGEEEEEETPPVDLDKEKGEADEEEPIEPSKIDSEEEEEEEESSEESEEAETGSEEDEEDEGASSEGNLREVANMLQQRGSIPEDEDLDSLDAEGLADLIEDSIALKKEEGLEQIIEGWKEGLGEEGQEFIRFTMAGGKPDEFFKRYAQASLSSFDLNSETGQEQWVRHYLKKYEGLEDEEEIEDRVQYMVDHDKLAKTSSRYMDKAKALEKKQADADLAKRTEALRQREARTAKVKEDVKKSLKEAKELQGLPVTTLEKRRIMDFMFNPTVKTESGYVTGFAAKFKDISEKDPGKLALLGKLLMDDFDFEPLIRKGKNEANKEVKKEIQRAKSDKKPKTKTPNRAADRPVWDVFED